MRTSSEERTEPPFKVLQWVAASLALATAAAQFARFFYIALSRLAFPFSLEWMEGGSYVQVTRILAGLPLYVRPSFEFIPQIYPPVYFYLSALANLVVGNRFASLRLVSILATVGIFILIYQLVLQETGSRLGGALASGFFCATYALSGYWFDIARVDSLALAFLLLAAFFLRKDEPAAGVLGGLFLALSCFTKQTMLIVAGMLLLYALLPPRRNGLLFAGAAALAFAGGTFLLDWRTGGWYAYYIFHLPGRHNLFPAIASLIVSAREILFEQILRPVFIAAIVAALYLLVFPVRDDRSKEAIPDPVWSRKAVWALVFMVGIWAVSSLWYLASLPSDAEGGVLGPYSLARLALMAGPVFVGILICILAIKMRKEPAWVERLAGWLFGNIRHAPRISVAAALTTITVVLILSSIRPGIFDSLNATFLQRLSPYLLGPALFLGVVLVMWRLLWSSYRLETWFFLLLFSGLLAASWLGRLNPGGYANVFMTAYAGIAILFGLGIAYLLKALPVPAGLHPVKNGGTLLKKAPASQPVSGRWIPIAVLALSAAQLMLLFSPPAAQIPTQADKEAGQELLGRIRACPGEVYIPFHTYLAVLAGKNGYAGVVEMGELRGSFGGRADPLWDEVLAQIQGSLQAQAFAAVIQDNQLFRDAMSSNYVEAGQVFEKELVFWPVTGRKVRPETVYTPTGGGACVLTEE